MVVDTGPFLCYDYHMVIDRKVSSQMFQIITPDSIPMQLPDYTTPTDAYKALKGHSELTGGEYTLHKITNGRAVPIATAEDGKVSARKESE